MGKLIGMMLTHNDQNSYYLTKVLSKTIQIVDTLYVLDDHSIDNTFEIAKQYTPHVYHAENTWLIGELDLRKELIDIILNNDHPDWLIQIDSDDFHCSTRLELERLMGHNYNWISFKWYNMLEDEKYYRLPIGTAPRMFRVNCVNNFVWSEQKYHVNLPINVLKLDGFHSDLKIKHLGQINDQIIKQKYERKTQIEDPNRQLFNDNVYNDYLRNDNEIIEWKD